MLPVIPLSDLTIIRRFPSRMYMNDGELDVLVGLFAAVRPKTVIEFGVNTGMTAQVLLKYVPSIQNYQGIDVRAGYRTTLPGQQSEVPMSPGFLVNDDDRFELILPDRGSYDLRTSDLRPCDAVFIDGDHSYDGVMTDSRLAFELIQPGGVIIWHDYNNPTVEVTQALEDLVTFDHHRIFHIENTWLAVERF